MARLRHLLAAALAATTAFLPAIAEARDHRHRDYWYDRDYREHRHRDWRYDHRRHDRRDNDDDELAAGAVGLVLGAVLGAAIASSSQPSRSGYYAPPPPPRNYYPPPPAYYPPSGYGPQPWRAAPPPSCVLRERVWDPYAGQYVRVERRIPC
jgi:hypothetical protein